MRRFLLAAALLALAIVAGLGFHAVARERQFRELIQNADAALAADDTATAVEHLSGAIALRPDSTLAWYRRGSTYHARGDLTAALRDLRQAVALDPTATRALDELGDVYFELRKYTRAAEEYDAYLAVDDRDPRVFYKLGLSRYHEGLAERAETATRRSLALDARNADAHLLLGMSLLARDRARDALGPLREAARLASGSVTIRETLADAYRRLGRRPDEIRELESLTALDADSPPRHAALALAYARSNRTEIAVLTLARAMHRFPDDATLLTTLGEVWLIAAETQDDRVADRKALQALERAVTQDGRSTAWTLLGRAYLVAGEPRRAILPLERATMTFPVDDRAYELLADAASRTGRFAQAREALARAIALEGESALARDGWQRAQRLGDWSMALRDPGEAARWYDRAVRLRPEDAVLVTRLAEAELGAGRNDAAATAITRYLATHPATPALARLQARIGTPAPR